MSSNIIHFGIIPDGARRWAENNQKDESYSYRITMEKLAKVIEFLFNSSVSIVSVFLSSRNNIFNRSEENKANFLSSQNYFMAQLMPDILKKYDIKIVFAGNKEYLPETYRNQVNQLEQRSIEYSSKILFLLIGYCPIDEINYALKKEPILKIENLWVNQQLDIVMRTGVKGRISDFLPLQSSYAELFFLNKYFPDINIDDIKVIFEEYNNRKRRFGF